MGRAMPGNEIANDADPGATEVGPGADPEFEGTEDEDGNEEPSFFTNPKRLLQTFALVVILILAIYVLLPNVVGLDDALDKLGSGEPVWLAIAFVFTLLMFFSYVALFRGVVGEKTVHLDWRESYEITMAGLAATRLFSAGGAGGIALTYWALRKAGMERRFAASRMLTLLVLLYGVYLLTLIINGTLMRTGVFDVDAPTGLTTIPAAIAGGIIILLVLVTLLPHDIERRMANWTRGYRFGLLLKRLATVPATLAAGTRTAIAFVREPSRGGLAVIGAIGFWATQIGILWASFHAYDVQVPLAILVQGFFIGMVANLIPFAPGGVGAVDAGMIGTFVLFGLDGSTVFAAILTYRLFAFWLPIPPGIVAFFQLRQTVARWQQERDEKKAAVQARFAFAGDPTSESKVH